MTYEETQERKMLDATTKYVVNKILNSKYIDHIAKAVWERIKKWEAEKSEAHELHMQRVYDEVMED